MGQQAFGSRSKVHLVFSITPSGSIIAMQNAARLHSIENFSASASAADPASLLNNGHFNKGTAFTDDERDRLGLRGLLPPRVESIENQAERCMVQIEQCASNLEKFNYLQMVKHTNETLFYYLLTHHMAKLTPLVYTPVVGEACQKFGDIFRVADGLYLSRRDKGQIRRILENWKRDVSIIVVTDGSRILGLGDQGAGGMGIPIGKLSLYVAAAGFHPASYDSVDTLPIQLDCGTDRESLLNGKFYLGTPEKRLADEEYYAFLEEFTMAVKDKWPHCLLQFEDFSNNHCFELLERYRNRVRCFNDDIQGTGAVIASGFITATKVQGVHYNEQHIVFLGAGSAGIGVADQIVQVMVKDDPRMTLEQARQRFYFVDSKGLVTKQRPGELERHKLPYARSDMKEIKTLLEVIQTVKPTALVGLSGVGGQFDEAILKELAKHQKTPIIFALSNPTSNSECTAEAAYKATEGRCLFASGSPFPNVTLADGRVFQPGQGNNMYIFPGLGFGAWLVQAKIVSDGMLIAATLTLSSCVTKEDLAVGRIYPALDRIREISTKIAVAVMEVAFEEKVAGIDRPADLTQYVKARSYVPLY